MSHVIKEGYLECLARGVGNSHNWIRRYYILRGEHEKANARLDYYDSKDESRTSPKQYKSVLLENLNPSSLSAEKGQDGFFEIRIEQKTPSSTNQVQILKYRTKIKKDFDEWRSCLLKEVKRPKAGYTSPAVTVTSSTTDSWPESQHCDLIDLSDTGEFDSVNSMDENFIYESLDNRTVKVKVAKSDAATMCNLGETVYMLSITSQHLALNTADGSNKTLYVWPYKYIRRYGQQKNSVVFEAGRKCSSGPGTFTLICVDVPASCVQEWIQQQTKQIQTKEHIGQDLSQSKDYSRKDNSSPLMENKNASDKPLVKTTSSDKDYYNTQEVASGRDHSPPADYEDQCYYNLESSKQDKFKRQDSSSGPELPNRGYGESIKRVVGKGKTVQEDSSHVSLPQPQNLDKAVASGNTAEQTKKIERKLSFPPAHTALSAPPTGPPPPVPVLGAAAGASVAAGNKKAKDEGKKRGFLALFSRDKKKDVVPPDENHYDDPVSRDDKQNPEANLYDSTYETQPVVKPKPSDLVAELKRGQRGQVLSAPVAGDENCYDTVSIDNPMPGKRTSAPQQPSSCMYDEVSISQQSANAASRVTVGKPPTLPANDIEEPTYESVAPH